ncbi:MAG: PKD domain-containing protein, partial [Bacteroidetes bacterium]|nr:PKD domain-containing protein [Bacteroidota bacterium]
TVGWTTSKAAQYHKYKTEGDYIVTLIAKSACGYDTFKGKVSVYYNPQAAFAFDQSVGCKPLSVHLIDTSKGRGLTRLWTVTEGTNTYTFTDSILNYTFTRHGVNSVSLRVTNPCGSSTISRNFKVNDKPNAGFANISGTCVPMTVNFNNTTSSDFSTQTYFWDFGDSTTSTQKNPGSKIYTLAGNYTVKLIVTDSCGSDTFTQTFTAYGMPVAILSGDTVGCTFDSLSFNNQSTNSTTYNWSFGDNTSATTNSAGVLKKVYTSTGNFTVRLIAGTGAGCKDTTYHNLYIKPGAKAQFNLDKTYGCAPVTFKFSNSSFFAKDYKWFANGRLISTNAVPNDTTLGTDSSVVKIKLLVTSASSCQGDSMEKTIFTAKNPKAIINNKDSGCGVLTVNFANASQNAVTYNWSFGNGTSSTLKNPTAKFQQAYVKDTIYKVQLKVTNWLGCKDSTVGSILVFPSPTSEFSVSTLEGCGPLSVNFTNLSRTNNNKPFSSLKHDWKFENGTTSKDVDPSATYTASAYTDTLYTVKLKVTSANGCANSSVQTITVFPQPKIQFTPDKTSGCALLPVKFKNLSSPMDTGNIDMMKFRWYSGNGNSDTSIDFNASYNASNYSDTVYTVKLIGYSEHGCVDSSTFNITVHPQPVARLLTDKVDGCTPFYVKANNVSYSKDGGPISHAYDFGNGFKSFQSNDSTVYLNSTDSTLKFNIVYQAISQYGCRDTAERQILVYPKPKAAFDVSTKKACAPVLVNLKDKSVNAHYFYWGTEGQALNKGNANTSIILDGINLFDSLYIIKHVVVSNHNCISDTAYQQVIAMGKPKAEFTFNKDSGCAKEKIQLINTSLGAYRYTWRFGDNTTSTAVNPKHKFPIQSGTGRDTVYQVRLEVSSVTGCKDTSDKPVYLVNKPLDNILLDKPLGCTDLMVNMKHQSTSFTTLYWDLGDGSAFATTDSVNHTYVNPMANMTMQPKISLYRKRFNCLDTASTFVMVYPKPISDFKAQRNDPCDAGNYQFINKSKNNVSNQWLFNDGTVMNVSSFSTVLPASQEKDTFYNVKLYVKNNYQCVDS